MDMVIVGLGKMGGNMAQRLLKGGHRVVGLDQSAEVTRSLAAEHGLTPAFSTAEAIAALSKPRVFWMMVPAGAVTESVVNDLAGLLSAGDVIIDGGNTFYKDDIRRAEMLKPKQIHYIDVGTSGGVWGLAEGYSLMIGGEAEVVEDLRPIFETLAPCAGARLGTGRTGGGRAFRQDDPQRNRIWHDAGLR